MALYKYYPIPCDRMGFLWCTTQIKDICILEFGPMGTTNFATRHMGENAGFFTTHISDRVLTFGSTDVLFEALKEIDSQNSPKIIFIMLSAVTSIIGIDIQTVCLDFQQHIKAKLVGVECSGLGKDYTHGIKHALTTTVKLMTTKCEKQTKKYNIIGACADEYMIGEDIKEIKRLMKKAFDFECISSYSYDTSYSEIRKSSGAEINLVLREEAIECAQYLKSKYNIPYVFYRPYGIKGTKKWIEKIENILQITADWDSINEEISNIKNKYSDNIEVNKVCILGNKDLSTSLYKLFDYEFDTKDIKAFIFSKNKVDINENITKYDENKFEEYISNNKPSIILGNCIAVDYPNNDNAIKISIQKPSGIPGFEEITFPLMGLKGFEEILKITT